MIHETTIGPKTKGSVFHTITTDHDRWKPSIQPTHSKPSFHPPAPDPSTLLHQSPAPISGATDGIRGIERGSEG